MWLNASDVASYFRSLGIDLDSSLDVVEVETTLTFWSNIWNEAQDVPTTGLITSYSDGFAGATRAPSEFGFCTEDPTYNARDFGGSVMFIDVSRLIHGKHLSSSVALWHIIANTNAKRLFKGRDVILKTQHSTDLI